MAKKTQGKMDIAILDASGTEIGFNLVRDKNGIPIYEEYTSEALAQQQIIGAPEYSGFKAEEEIRLIGDDFRGGFGLEYAGYQTDRYHYSINADARFGGKLRLAQTSTAATLPTVTALTIANADMELDASWENGAGSTARSATVAHGGTYSWRVAPGASATWAYQDIQSGTDYKGRKVTFKCWVYTHNANKGRIGIDDGSSTISYSSYHNGDSKWAQLTVTKKIYSDADKLRLILHNADTLSSTQVDFDDASLIPPTKGEVNSQVDFNNDRYAVHGNILMKLNDAGTAYEYVWNTTDVTQMTDLCAGVVAGVDYLFLCQGWSNDYWYMLPTSLSTCNAVWTELSDVDVTPTADTTDYVRGTGSLKLVVAAGCAANDILATQAITSVDLSGHEAITLHIKSSVALDAGDIQFLLDDTAKCASITKALDIPAITADTWTAVQIELDDASGLGAIISIGIKMVVDKAAFTLRIDDIRALNFTQTDITGAEIKHMVMDGLTFRGSNTNSTIMSTTAPLAGGTNWGTSYQVGEDAHDIVDIKMYGGLPYIKKANSKVYYLSATPAIVPFIEGQAGTNTARMYVHRKADLIIPYGEQGLLHWDGTTLSHIEPALYMDNAGDFSGQVQAVTGDDMCLYIVMDDGTDIQVLSSKLGATVSDWGWHPLRTIATFEGCASASISTIYKKRMWIGSTLSTDSFYYLPVTTKYGDIESDTNITYLTGGYGITPLYHLNLRGDKKAWVKITLTQAHTYDKDIYWECHYKKLSDAGWTDIGDFKGSATTDITTAYLPVDASSNKPSSEMMQFKFVGVTDDTAKTPILLSFDVQAIWYPVQKRVIHCLIEVEDDAVTAQGMRDVVRAETKKALLDELYNPATAYPRTFYPLEYDWRAGTGSKTVKALPPKKAKPSKYEASTKYNRISYVYDVWLEEVTTS